VIPSAETEEDAMSWFNHGAEDLRRRRGQGTTEYGLILVLIGVFAILALGTNGEEVSRLLQAVADRVSQAG
jgi:Flp pilus assembly pilin Flp